MKMTKRPTRGIRRGRPPMPADRQRELKRLIEENPGLSSYKIGLFSTFSEGQVWYYRAKWGMERRP